MENLNVIWGLPASAKKTRKTAVVEKYDYPVMTVLPTPTEGKKNSQVHFNTAAITALGVEKGNNKVAFGLANNNFVVKNVPGGPLTVSGANNVSNKDWHMFICTMLVGTQTTDTALEIRLTVGEDGILTGSKDSMIDALVEPVEDNTSVEVETPVVEEAIFEEPVTYTENQVESYATNGVVSNEW